MARLDLFSVTFARAVSLDSEYMHTPGAYNAKSRSMLDEYVVADPSPSFLVNRDALGRHCRSVHGVQAEDNPTRITNPRKRVQSACQECRRQKQRCDGRNPCGRCRLRSSECTYSRPDYPPTSQDMSPVRSTQPSLVCYDKGNSIRQWYDHIAGPAEATPVQTTQSSFQSQWTLADDHMISQIPLSSAGPSCHLTPTQTPAHDLSIEPTGKESPSDHSPSPWNSMTETPLDTSRLGSSSSSSKILPLCAESADLEFEIEFPLPSLRGANGGSEATNPLRWKHQLRQCRNTTENGSADSIKSWLPPACLVRTSYDRLHARLSEVIYHGSDTSIRVVLPPRDSLNSFIASYFENFSPLFPILSSADFDADSEHYLLVLSVCTIGVSFLAETQLQILCLMRSLLRKHLDGIVSLS